MQTSIEKEVYQKYKRFTVYKFYKVIKDKQGHVIKREHIYNSTWGS